MAKLAEALKELSPVKKGDDVLEVASAARINAIQDAILALARGDNIVSGVNLLKKNGASWVILSGTPGGGSNVGSSVATPFQVYAAVDNSVPPYPVLRLRPGKIATIVPTVNGVPLDQPPDAFLQPWLYTPGENFSIALKCTIDLTVPNSQYRSNISTVEVVTSDTIPAEDKDDTAKVRELEVTWTGGTDDEKELKNKGYFYLLVADVIGSQDAEGNIGVGAITQWIFSSYQTFAIAGDEAIIMV